MYEAVWVEKIRIFVLNHHIKERAENVRNRNGNKTENAGTHIGYHTARGIRVRNILEEEVARRRERNHDRGKEDRNVRQKVFHCAIDHVKTRVIALESHCGLIGGLRGNKRVSSARDHWGECRGLNGSAAKKRTQIRCSVRHVYLESETSHSASSARYL